MVPAPQASAGKPNAQPRASRHRLDACLQGHKLDAHDFLSQRSFFDLRRLTSRSTSYLLLSVFFYCDSRLHRTRRSLAMSFKGFQKSVIRVSRAPHLKALILGGGEREAAKIPTPATVMRDIAGQYCQRGRSSAANETLFASRRRNNSSRDSTLASTPRTPSTSTPSAASRNSRPRPRNSTMSRKSTSRPSMACSRTRSSSARP